ncbi:taxadiene 5-alpha hydroxylase-like [Senna tora]|uniref:Taxadiene 5-alpha hydroxylase-like n=1 Tax=Senna tora TaxID=362788 RepID=A0A834WED5_9FABA|nr:taxadiene 5-alpha hydroxylase-like [Senna tora]
MELGISFLTLIAITLITAFFLFSKLFISKGQQPKNLPKGSLGYPIIGETFSFVKAQKKEKGNEWLEERICKYGPVFKTSLMGSPTVVFNGQAGNKFIMGAPLDVFASNKPITLQKILGKQSLAELSGSRYKLVKGAMLDFLKPECLQNYVKEMDELASSALVRETKGKETIGGVVFVKRLAFEMACKILLGIKDEQTVDALFEDFGVAFKALYSLPLNLPGTTFWRGIRARARTVDRVLPIIAKRREQLSKGILSPTNDLLSCLLALRDENNQPLSDDVVTDNFVFSVIASHDTSATLLSLMVWKLARDPNICNKVFEEQMEIIKQREEGAEERLTWGEIQKMKYTWRVAQEVMRTTPPLFGSFRKTLKDTNFAGYDIPKGWQVYWTSYGTHMNDEIFKNPKEFDPSRFENPTKPIPPFAFVAFGAGLRSCIGNEFARVETLTTIHNLVKRYEWSLVNPEEAITRQPMPYPSMGLPINIKPRYKI